MITINNTKAHLDVSKPTASDGTAHRQFSKVTVNKFTSHEIIWTADETLFNNIRVGDIATAKGNAYQSSEAQSRKYNFNYSDWGNILLTGRYRFEINGKGTYTVSNKAELRGTINGRDTLIDTINSTNDNGDKIFTINKNISISKYSGNGDLYLYIWIRNSNNGETSGGRLSLENMTCILS